MRISDWSSDVCSSDLQHFVHVARVEVADRPLDEVGFLVDEGRRGRLQRGLAAAVPQAHQVFVVAADLHLRSEARRVGNECVSTCRSPCSPYHSNKNTLFFYFYLLPFYSSLYSF